MTEDLRPGERDDLIERIVRDVLARLDGTNRPQEETTNSTNDTDIAGANGQPPARWVLAGRVITVETLHGKLVGPGEVGVEREAVITPAARDALRQAGVRLVRDGGGKPSGLSEAVRLVVGMADCDPEPAVLTRLGDLHRGEVQHLARMGLVEVVREMTEQVLFSGCKGILFTDRGAAAVCLANRHRGVRAVTGRSVGDVEMAVASVGANLLVIQPTGLSSWAQLRMASVLLAGRASEPFELGTALN